jgi:hypothetical protein
VRLSSSRFHQVITSALLDSGANACFMDRDFALKHNILLQNLPSPAPINVIDGRPISSGDIVEESEAVHVLLSHLACVINFIPLST